MGVPPPPQPTKGSGERRELPSPVRDGAGRKRLFSTPLNSALPISLIPSVNRLSFPYLSTIAIAGCLYLLLCVYIRGLCCNTIITLRAS